MTLRVHEDGYRHVKSNGESASTVVEHYTSRMLPAVYVSKQSQHSHGEWPGTTC